MPLTLASTVNAGGSGGTGRREAERSGANRATRSAGLEWVVGTILPSSGPAELGRALNPPMSTYIGRQADLLAQLSSVLWAIARLVRMMVEQE